MGFNQEIRIQNILAFSSPGRQVSLTFEDDISVEWTFLDMDGDGDVDVIETERGTKGTEQTEKQTERLAFMNGSSMKSSFSTEEKRKISELFHEGVQRSIRQGSALIDRVLKEGKVEVVTGFSTWFRNNWLNPGDRLLSGSLGSSEVVLLDENGDGTIEFVDLKSNDTHLFFFQVNRSFIVDYSSATYVSQYLKLDTDSWPTETTPFCKSEACREQKSVWGGADLKRVAFQNRKKAEKHMKEETAHDDLERAWVYYEKKEGGKELVEASIDSLHHSVGTPLDVFCMEDPTAYQALSHYHTHPNTISKSYGAFPSEMDFIYAVLVATLLNHQNFEGQYDIRVITPIGIFILTPNREWMRNDPKLFREKFKSIAYDDIRVDLSSKIGGFSVSSYIERVSSEAVHVSFAPLF